MSAQLDFGSATPRGTRTFFLDVQDGLGWSEVADADSPQELVEEARQQRDLHPGRPIAIRSRDPRHDSFVAGWKAYEKVKDLPDWINGRIDGDEDGPPW